MNSETKQKLMSGTDQSALTSGNACWETPPEVFAVLNEQLGGFGPFDVDICADATRALCGRWFGPGSAIGTDALAADWRAHGARGFCNPPYGAFIGKILPVAKRQREAGFTSVFLIPMRVTQAFKSHIMVGASDLLFCDKRITFFEHGVPRLNTTSLEKGRLVGDSAVFDSIIVVYDGTRRTTGRPDVRMWQVPPHVSQADLERAADQRRQMAA